MGAERQYRVLNSFPILRYVRLMTESNGKQIQFFASHDTIIGSILRVLTDSGKYIDWQVFAARLIFEVSFSICRISLIRYFQIYETTENAKFLRVVYDGEDITTSVKFCKNLEYGLCPVSDLKLFMEKGIFEMAGFEKFEQICTDHRQEFNFV